MRRIKLGPVGMAGIWLLMLAVSASACSSRENHYPLGGFPAGELYRYMPPLWTNPAAGSLIPPLPFPGADDHAALDVAAPAGVHAADQSDPPRHAAPGPANHAPALAGTHPRADRPGRPARRRHGVWVAPAVEPVIP